MAPSQPRNAGRSKPSVGPAHFHSATAPTGTSSSIVAMRRKRSASDFWSRSVTASFSEPRSPGAIHFARSLPIAKARQADVLLAYRMGNADLPANNGFPLRAVVPGWYGMASVKWLTRIVVTDRPFNGFFQSIDYSIYERRDDLVTVTPVTRMQVKSVIVSPTAMQRIAPNTAVRVHGAAQRQHAQEQQRREYREADAGWLAVVQQRRGATARACREAELARGTHPGECVQ